MKTQILILATILTLSLAGFAQEKEVEVIVTTQKANVHESPSLTAKVVGTVKQGEKLATSAYQGNWYYVVGNKVRGWVHYSTIKKTDAKTSKPIQEKTKDYSDVYKDTWTKFEESNNDKLWYYNASKMRRQGSVVSIWVQTRNKTTYNLTSTAMWQIDCNEQRTRAPTGVTYTENGTVDGSWDDPNYKWRAIIPDTISESLMKIVCKYSK
jgi:uncharacterized protein YgiM (DUF1202 family)